MGEATGASGAHQLSSGSRIGRYEIVRSVAAGGMGHVWQARLSGEHGFEKRVAIKMMLPEMSADPRLRRMFLDEARLCARLSHACVAQILDVGEHAELPYIVFEWVEGPSLLQLCTAAEQRQEPLPIGPVLRVVADVCGGLHAAHELADPDDRPLGVVHRDVTPGNIIVSPEGFAKLIDFGLAKARNRLAGETRTGVVKGTPQYMAPEQARGEHVDRRCDVWGLGAVLYRCLGARPPFEGRGELEAFALGRTELAALPTHVPASVVGVVARAMAREPGARFTTAEELKFAIEEALVTVDARPRIAALCEALAPAKPAASEQATERDGAAIVESPPQRGVGAPDRPRPKQAAASLRIAFAAALLLAAAMAGLLVWTALR